MLQGSSAVQAAPTPPESSRRTRQAGVDQGMELGVVGGRQHAENGPRGSQGERTAAHGAQPELAVPGFRVTGAVAVVRDGGGQRTTGVVEAGPRRGRGFRRRPWKRRTRSIQRVRRRRARKIDNGEVGFRRRLLIPEGNQLRRGWSVRGRVRQAAADRDPPERRPGPGRTETGARRESQGRKRAHPSDKDRSSRSGAKDEGNRSSTRGAS